MGATTIYVTHKNVKEGLRVFPSDKFPKSFRGQNIVGGKQVPGTIIRMAVGDKDRCFVKWDSGDETNYSISEPDLYIWEDEMEQTDLINTGDIVTPISDRATYFAPNNLKLGEFYEAWHIDGGTILLKGKPYWMPLTHFKKVEESLPVTKEILTSRSQVQVGDKLVFIGHGYNFPGSYKMRVGEEVTVKDPKGVCTDQRIITNEYPAWCIPVQCFRKAATQPQIEPKTMNDIIPIINGKAKWPKPPKIGDRLTCIFERNDTKVGETVEVTEVGTSIFGFKRDKYNIYPDVENFVPESQYSASQLIFFSDDYLTSTDQVKQGDEVIFSREHGDSNGLVAIGTKGKVNKTAGCNPGRVTFSGCPHTTRCFDIQCFKLVNIQSQIKTEQNGKSQGSAIKVQRITSTIGRQEGRTGRAIPGRGSKAIITRGYFSNKKAVSSHI